MRSLLALLLFTSAVVAAPPKLTLTTAKTDPPKEVADAVAKLLDKDAVSVASDDNALSLTVWFRSELPTTASADQIKNGTVTFTTNPAVLTAPSTVTGAEAGCPNPNWTGVNPTLTVTDITMTIAQGGVTLFTCSASDPNGLTGRVALSC